VAKAFGFQPTVTIITGTAVSGDRLVGAASMDGLRNIETELLIYIDKTIEVDDAKRLLRRRNFRFGDFIALSPALRAALVAEALATSVDEAPQVSTGLFAACLTCVAESSSATLAGFSLKGGHSYIKRPTRRYHAADDEKALRILFTQQRTPMFTTNAAFGELGAEVIGGEAVPANRLSPTGLSLAKHRLHAFARRVNQRVTQSMHDLSLFGLRAGH
jgi:hypothetical protein